MFCWQQYKLLVELNSFCFFFFLFSCIRWFALIVASSRFVFFFNFHSFLVWKWCNFFKMRLSCPEQPNKFTHNVIVCYCYLSGRRYGPPQNTTATLWALQTLGFGDDRYHLLRRRSANIFVINCLIMKTIWTPF